MIEKRSPYSFDSLDEYVGPLVSVIMATHNRGDLIGRAIESVMSQTYPSWELIIVADGCTDDTNKIVSEYVTKDDRIFHYPVQKMEYYTHVRNFGIEKSSGDLICFRDDDGAWTDNFIEEMVERHRPDDVAIAYCGRILVNGVDFSSVGDLEDVRGREMPIVRFSGSESLTNEIDVGDIMIKRSVFDDKFKGFTEEKDMAGYCSDARLVDEIYKKHPHMKFVPVPLYMHYYFQNHGGVVENMTQRKLKYRQKYGELGPEEAEPLF